MKATVSKLLIAISAALFSFSAAKAELTDSQAQLARTFGIAKAYSDRCSGVETNSDLMVQMRKDAGVTRRQAMVGGVFNRALLARYGTEHAILWAIADERQACAAGVLQFGPVGTRIPNLLIIDPLGAAGSLLN